MIEILASVHVMAGMAGLLIGALLLWTPKQRGMHTRGGALYFAIVTLVCVTAVVLASASWSTRFPFVFIAIGTFTCAAIGYVAAVRRRRNWLLWHVAGQTCSYGGLVTAFVVNQWEALTGVPGLRSPYAFLTPMSIATLGAGWLLWQVYRGHRPRYRREAPLTT
ncbi:MAG TPA: hypothetical protein VJ691_12870 [Vicinamibacterales bacterium]|nr:hypothetical protein [Vicinamibacterales bacterium]